MVVNYPINVGGRPMHSWPAFLPVTFEMAVLGAAIFTVLGMPTFAGQMSEETLNQLIAEIKASSGQNSSTPDEQKPDTGPQQQPPPPTSEATCSCLGMAGRKRSPSLRVEIASRKLER